MTMELKEREEKIIETLSHCSDFGDPREYYKELIELRKQAKMNKNFEFLTEIMRALGNKDRFIIVDMLRQKDRCICELEVLLDKSQGAVSRQLKILEESNLIKGWKQGKFTHYSLVKPIFEKFLNIISNWSEKTTNWFGELPVVSEI